MANWSRRVVAVFALLVVGAVLSLAFGVALSGGLPAVDYVAREVDPATEPDVVANASGEVLNLDHDISHTPSIEPAIEAAAERGVYEGTAESPNQTGELYLFADDADQKYAVYENRYYRWNSTTRPEDDYVRIRLDPASAEAVMDDLAVPYAEGSPASKRLVRDRTSDSTATPNERLVVRNGTYYAISPKSEASVFAKLIAAVTLFVVSVPGRAYLGCGLGLLVSLRSGDPFPLGPKRGLAVAGVVLPVSLALATLASGSELINYGVVPAAACLVALGLPFGALLRRWRLRRVAVVVGGGWLTVTVVSGLVYGVLGVVGAAFGLGALSVAGLPLVPYGYYLTDPA